MSLIDDFSTGGKNKGDRQKQYRVFDDRTFERVGRFREKNWARFKGEENTLVGDSEDYKVTEEEISGKKFFILWLH